jgi:hypothetical protein
LENASRSLRGEKTVDKVSYAKGIFGNLLPLFDINSALRRGGAFAGN